MCAIALGERKFALEVLSDIDFVRDNPALASKTAQNNCEALANGFDKEWRNKVKQFQTPIFSRSTKGAWVLRFDDILADALELGALRKDEVILSDEDIQAVASLIPKDVPSEVIHTLIAYYRANKPENSDWVVLPVIRHIIQEDFYSLYSRISEFQ